MHFEVLIEDQSGKYLVDTLLEKILGERNADHSWRTIGYRGVGRIPKNLVGVTDPNKRILLDQLPRILRGYGKSLDRKTSAVIVIVDLDDRECISFKNELAAILDVCIPAPRTLFRIAIEETEAWLLGDQAALKDAYPQAKLRSLAAYPQDGIVGTWEVLADVVHSGGAKELKKLGYPEIGKAKCKWAQDIAPHMDISINQSKSFQVFRDGVRQLAKYPE